MFSCKMNFITYNQVIKASILMYDKEKILSNSVQLPISYSLKIIITKKTYSEKLVNKYTT